MQGRSKTKTSQVNCLNFVLLAPYIGQCLLSKVNKAFTPYSVFFFNAAFAAFPTQQQFKKTPRGLTYRLRRAFAPTGSTPESLLKE